MELVKIIITGRFPCLNGYINACRTNRQMAARMKSQSMKEISQQLHAQLQCSFPSPVELEYRYFEPNRKRDKSNISGYFHKVFEDALVSEGFIKNDGWNDIEGFRDVFAIDRDNPRIEITVHSKENGIEQIKL